MFRLAVRLATCPHRALALRDIRPSVLGRVKLRYCPTTTTPSLPIQIGAKPMTTDRLLLDTCAVIWMATDAKISDRATAAINAAAGANVDVLVSPITAWELGLLSAKRRLPAAQGPTALFNDFLTRPAIGLERLTPAILIDSSFLPGDFHSDPVDRIIVATARAFDLTVVTRDSAILDYAKQGYVRALPC